MKPMLASPVDLTQLKYPVLASPKLDGVRCLIINGVAVSRALKPIPNQWVQKCFGRRELNGLDGELIVGDVVGGDVFQRTTSGVMSVEGKPDVIFYVFDDFSQPEAFNKRLASAYKRIKRQRGPIEHVLHSDILTEDRLLKFESQLLEEGFEGVMLRDPNGFYKSGRSTVKEGKLLKLKRFVDAEATVIGFTALMHNTNEAKKNALGQTERSSHQAGKVALEQIGSLAVKDLKTGIAFDIGAGFDTDQRRLLWLRRDALKGRIVKYKSQPTGVKDKPRFPVFIGFRDVYDL